jgi:pimeloyl-ACP methyl ester carboxylesterase
VWWVVGVAGVVCAGWSLASVRRILYPEHRPIPPPDPLPSSTPHALTSPDGARFTVWVLEASAPRARILIVHGFYANRLQVLDIAEGLRERGYEAVIVELRGHGDRPGPCTVGVKETEDAVAVLRWARERDGRRPLPVGLLGLSMGAAVACQVALREPAVRAVVVDSVYSRLFPVLVRAIRDRYRLPPVPWAWLTWWTLQLALGCRLSPWDPVSAAPQLRQPLFAIQGGEDRRVAPLLGREFYRRWAGPKERWFEPKVAHVGMFARHPRAYGERVAAFFDRAMR